MEYKSEKHRAHVQNTDVPQWLAHLPKGTLRELVRENAELKEMMIQTSKRGSLRVFHFIPRKEKKEPPLVFVAGWGSSIEDWRWFLHGMSKHREIFYIESREKKSSTYSIHNEFDPFTLAKDIEEVVKAVGIEKSFILMGSSLGATTSICYALQSSLLPEKMILIGPVSEFPLPFWIKLVTYIPTPILAALRPIIKWYITNKVLDPKKDPEQAAKARRNIDNAHLGKLKKSGRAMIGFSIKERLPNVKVRTLVIGASWDKAHAAERSREIAEAMSNALYVDILTNARAHEYVAVDVVELFIENDENEEEIINLAATPYPWQEEEDLRRKAEKARKAREEGKEKGKEKGKQN